MVTPRRESQPSPSLEEPFFSLFSSSSLTLAMAPPTPEGMEGSGGIETDLILAAELGRALLERNEELTATLEEREREIESLQQEKHSLQRKVEMSELVLSQREAELTSDLATLRAELERHHGQGRDRRRDESEQLTQLANHNHRLVEQLAEAVTLEHTLRTELRSLREEREETDFNRNISNSQLDNIQAENRVLQERLTRMEKQLKASQDDSDRLRVEREGLRENLSDLLDKMREKEAELEEEQGMVFELRSLNRSLQQRALLDLVDENGLEISHIQPLSLLSEIQQSQAKDALLTHSAALQARDDEIQTLKQQLQSQQDELESFREQLKSFGGPGKPSYSSLENELVVVRQERDSLTQQLLNTIKHKVALSQEVDAWQEDMRLVINEQVQQREEERQKEKEKEKEKEKTTGLQRSKSLRLRGDGGKGFFSSLFGDK